jgi:hypothetical protein
LVGLCLIAAIPVFFFVRPRIMSRLQRISTQPGTPASQYIGFGRQTVIILNPTDKDWGYTTVTVNDDYKANCPQIPKGTQFEIWYKSFRGPKGEFDPRSQKVQAIKIEPEGEQVITWKPPIE